MSKSEAGKGELRETREQVSDARKDPREGELWVMVERKGTTQSNELEQVGRDGVLAAGT